MLHVCTSCPHRTGPIQPSQVRLMHVIVHCNGSLHYIPIYGSTYGCTLGGSTKQLDNDDIFKEGLQPEMSRWKRLNLSQERNSTQKNS
jgi:hypothetical protein